MCLLCDQLPIAPEICVFDPQVIDGTADVEAPLEAMIRAVENILITCAPQQIVTLQDQDIAAKSTPLQMMGLSSLTNTIEAHAQVQTIRIDMAVPSIPTTMLSTKNDLATAIKIFASDVLSRINNFTPTDPDPTTVSNPRGTQSAANLLGPLESIDWGWSVADQIPETGEHDIRVYFLPGGISVNTYFGDVTTTSWSASEKAAAQDVYAQFEAVADVNFIFVNDINNADFVMMSEHNTSSAGLLGYFSIGDSFINAGADSVLINGFGVFNDAGYGWDAGGLNKGGYGYLTLVHEIGHGMGLAHPHDDGGTSSIIDGVQFDTDTGRFGLNQAVYTVMTYNSGWVDGPVGVSPSLDYGYVGGPMALDIAVLQDTYGANISFASGNDIYTLADTNQRGTFYTTIWDTGGTDTIHYTGSSNSIINLTAATLDYSETGGGVVSYASGIYGGFTIANGVTIENAIGGSGDDTLTGNDADNVLSGGAGSDVLDGNGGNDTLVGGSGSDRFIFNMFSNTNMNAAANIGANTIQDFESGLDTIEFNTPTQAAAAQQGNNVFYDFGDGNTVVVLNATTGGISDDVLFI